MTSFDSHEIELGILTSPDHFEGEAAWVPFNPLASRSLLLEMGWDRHYLPVLRPSLPPGFDHALHTRLDAMARVGKRDDEGIIVGRTADPSGHLAFGPFDSLLKLLQSVDQNEFAKTSPGDYCASITIDDDDDLSWLNETPSKEDHERVQGIVERLAGAVALLDQNRAWALRVGDYHAEWHGKSPLAGLKDHDAFL
jgi:hypothetical protein